MTVNFNQRHLASDCGAVGGNQLGSSTLPRCGAWYHTECSWCGVKIHMHRKQWNSKAQTCSARCRVARHRANKTGA